VLNAKKPVPEATRAAAEQRIRQLGFDNRIVLNGEWDYTIVAAKAEYKDICTDIVNRCSDAFETGLTGNVMGRAARTAFTDAGIYHRTTAERRGAAADLWMRQIREKGLVHWGRDNYNTRQVPVGCLDVRSPEDKLAHAKSLAELGKGIKELVAGLKDAGVRPTNAWVQETMQTAGIRVEAIQRAGEHLFDLDSKDAAAGIKIDEWRQDQGMGPIGDERGSKTLAEAAAKAPAHGGAPAPPGGGPPVAMPPASPAPDARLEDEELLEDDEEDAIREKLAAEMNEAAYTACWHKRKRLCERCGVRGILSPDGAGGWRVVWRALKRPGPRARAKAMSSSYEQAKAELEEALRALDELYADEDGEDDADRARQERGPDGRFLPGDGSKRPAPKGPSPKGTKDGYGRSKAAGFARQGSTDAQAATKAAEAGGSHEDAAKAHAEAAAQHREAAAASARPEYRAAHEGAAAAHEKMAAAHAAEHAGQATVPVGNVDVAPGLPKDAAAKLLSSIKNPEILAVLRANPIKELRVGGKIEGHDGKAFGLYTPGEERLDVDHGLHDAYHGGVGIDKWDPSANTNPLRPGSKKWSTTTVGANADEMRELTFIHEVGHHVHMAGWPKHDGIVKRAYERSMSTTRGPITEYAETNHTEYFAESFALFAKDPDKLKRADPIAHKMVSTVLKRSR
jgi:hypothetical protein